MIFNRNYEFALFPEIRISRVLHWASLSSAHGLMSTSPLNRIERRIKGWFKCILGKQKQLDHKLSRLESHIYREEYAVGDDPPPDVEVDSDELDICVDEDAFSLIDDGEDVE